MLRATWIPPLTSTSIAKTSARASTGALILEARSRAKRSVHQNLYSTAPRIVFTLSQICRWSAKLAGANPKLKFSLVNPSKIYSPRMIQLEVNAYSTPPPMLKPFNHLFWETVNAVGDKQQVPVTDSFVFANVQPPAIYSSVFG